MGLIESSQAPKKINESKSSMNDTKAETTDN
jgi:hypothetical protein